jgi:CHASE3 domain sensor protein
MTEQNSTKLDRLIDDLERTHEILRRVSCLIEGMLASLSPEIEEKRKREIGAIAEIVQDSLLSKELPGSSSLSALWLLGGFCP